MAEVEKSTVMGLPDAIQVDSETYVSNVRGKSALATQTEHELSLREGFRIYRKAVAWSLFMCLGVIMAGFDPQLVGTLVAIPQFQQQFGYEFAPGQFVVPASWQSTFNLGVPIGQTVGSFVAGYPMEKYGRKKVMAACCVASMIIIAIQFSAQNRPQLLVAELLNGFVLGIYPILAPSYVGETCPVIFRGIGAAAINLSFVTGQLIASGVLAGTQGRPDRWSYGIPFACQWIFPLFILILLPWCPESPWWLVRQNRVADAKAALESLTTKGFDVTPTLANIEQTTKHEEELLQTASFTDCFKSTDLRRLIITSMVYGIQPLAGNALIIGYSVYFFELAGLDPSNAFALGVGLLGLGFVGTVLSWPLLARFGRRTIYNWGLFVLTLLCLLIGILDVVPYTQSVIWAQSIMMAVWNFFYDLSIGPLAFAIMCEVSSAKLRAKTISVATAFGTIFSIIFAIGIPYALNPDQGYIRGKLCFVFAGVSALCLIWCYFCLPETRGRTFRELDYLFENKVSARKFSSYKLESNEFDDPV